MSSLADRFRWLVYRNAELRLQNEQLTADLKAQIALTEKWIGLTNDWQREAVSWQQTAIAAIAKAEMLKQNK